MIIRSLASWSAMAALVVLTVGFSTDEMFAQRTMPQNTPRVRDGQTPTVIRVGRLVPAGLARDGSARYALLDRDGNRSAYVVPATGVNVAAEINRQVAVTARPVSRDRDGLPYLIAEKISRVAPLAANPKSRGRNGEGPEVEEPRIVADSDQAADSFERLTEWDDSLEWGSEFETHEEDFGATLAWDSELVPDGNVRHAALDYQDDESILGSTEVLPEGDVESLPMDESAASGCGHPGCSTCAPMGPCGDACCPCGPAGRYWFRVDYLGWSSKAMDTPPLVTTSPAGTPVQDAGVLGVGSTEILTGSRDADSQARNGVRFLLGGWLDRCQRRGIELDYYFLDEETENFSADSIGDPILARPFFNTELGIEDAELVAYPGLVSGSVDVSRKTEFQSFTPRYRHNLNCRNFYPLCGGCGNCGQCGPTACGPFGGSRVDLTIGYRYLRLNEGLYIREDLISSADNSFSTFELNDAFETSNEFSGIELGLEWDVHRGNWSMELAGRFSMGNNERKVAIHGETTTVTQGAVFNDVGGLLALPSNIGVYQDDEFVVIPEFTLTFGYQIAPQVRFLIGYTVVYWSNVVRPGDHIDLNVNPNLLPPAIDTDGMLSPAFALSDTSFWAQGVNLGLDWRW